MEPTKILAGDEDTVTEDGARTTLQYRGHNHKKDSTHDINNTIAGDEDTTVFSPGYFRIEACYPLIVLRGSADIPQYQWTGSIL